MNLFYIFYDKKVNLFSLISFLLLCLSSNLAAQINSADWELNTATARNLTTLPAIPTTALNTTISIEKFKQQLHSTKQEIQIPNPDGQFETFVIEPTDIVASEVAHLYTIKTFKGYKKDDPTVLFAGDISNNGFHAGIYAGENSYFIEPANTTPNTANQLKVYYKRESKANKVQCLVEKAVRQVVPANQANKRSAPTLKRNFRLAVVATGEFGQAFGGSPYSTTNVLNALASGVNLINPIYLRDLGVDFTLVSTAALVFDNPDTDAFDSDDENGFFQNLSSTIINALGVNGFDIGHAVIWDNIGGLASPGVCDEFAKTEGYSGADGSTTTLWVDYVAHEIGHQFNADHNFVSMECETSVDGLRYEPGEGSSIMAYAGVCGAPVEFANGSDPFFHYASIKTITDFLETISCATTTSTGNDSDPVANAQGDITIPKQTPFVLVGSGTDANDAASNLSYSWEQYDGASDAVSGPPDCNSTNAPLFRFRPPNSTGIRSFPQYTDVLAGNNNMMDWEKLPCAERDLNFSLAVRDNNPTFGRVTNDLMKITVANTGPFAVTAPNGGETLTGNMASTITWTVNGTDAHCSNVDILLSTDGGGTFTVIADATANDGTESVMIPNSASTTARVIVRCDVAGGFRSTSTFYDVSNAAFTITEGTTQVVDIDMDGVAAEDDCDDNNANVGAKQAAGTTCDDGNANTENDQIQADGCACAGTVIPACANNGGDADMDGVCADIDCDDNNANIGAKQAVGTACDDGDANTENDQIQADSCSCAGTAIPTCANNGGDADMDGVCADVDCDDNDATVGEKQPGIPCDDANAQPCSLDTIGLATYLSTLNLTENNDLAFEVKDNNSTFAVLHGTINTNSPNVVQTFIDNYPNVKTLVFMQIPGSADDDANLIASRKLKAQNYTAYLPAVNAYSDDAFIASGGVDMFMAGNVRVIDEGAEVGVHSWSDGTNEATDFPQGNTVHLSYIAYYVEMGFSQQEAEDFYYFTINAATANSIHNMTEAEIVQYKLRRCELITCSTMGGDADMDGVCADIDCDDNDPNIGAKQEVGTTCDDSNANTENDQIQADSCTCAGTVIPACANNGGDADMDGVCADVDCNDNDANIGAKQAAGTACDDGNVNTENDQIQADGCSCAGTVMEITCPAPSNPTAQNSSARSVSITWDAVTSAIGYKIQVRFKGQERWIVTANIPRNKVAVYAPPNKAYEYRIQSVCEDGVSEYSAIFEFMLSSNFKSVVASSRNQEEDKIDLTQYLETTVQLYPNPVKNKLNLQLDLIEKATISIYHTSGLLMNQLEINSGHTIQEFDVSQLETGLYFIKVAEFGKQPISKRFIKM